MKVACVHYGGERKVHKIDPKTNRVLKNEWWWFANCAIKGDEEEIGYDCGKGCCGLYQRKQSEKKGGGA